MSNAARLFCALSLPITVHAVERDLPEGARAVAEAEKQFATASREKGMGTAALENFAEGAISFDPAPTDGRKFWVAHLNDKEVLIWRPVFADCSHAGDFGYTTGPWELQKSRTEATGLAFGTYVTIWKKQPDNTWKVVLDSGVSHRAPTSPPSDIQFAPMDPGSANHDPELTKRALFKAQRAFLETAHKSASEAIMKSASYEIQVLRPDALPAVGIIAARLMLSAEHRTMVRKFSGSDISRSGDLAYNYGELSAQRGETTERGYYLMIWKLDLNGDWKLALDLEKRAPQKKE